MRACVVVGYSHLQRKLSNNPTIRTTPPQFKGNTEGSSSSNDHILTDERPYPISFMGCFVTRCPSPHKDTKLSVDEQKHLPGNLLMLKAMHDRERLATPAAAAGATTSEASESCDDGTLDAADREVVAKAAQFSSFAAAAYGVVMDFATLKEIVAKEASIPPHELLFNKCVFCFTLFYFIFLTLERQGVVGRQMFVHIQQINEMLVNRRNDQVALKGLRLQRGGAFTSQSRNTDPADTHVQYQLRQGRTGLRGAEG